MRAGSTVLNRRQFVRGTVASASVLLLSGCDDERKASSVAAAQPAAPRPSSPPQPLAEGLPREAVLELAEARVDHYMRLCHHCAQTSFLALHEVFGLGDASFVKALTPLPGIAERGETCGAVTGCLLALGLAFGRERLDDWAGWRACLVPARAFCDEFVAEMGSTQCADVVERVFGHRYNLADPADLARFQEATPTAKCGGVVRKAVRLAAGLILDKRGEERS